MPLSDKHEAFCQEYLVDFNGTQSAIRAGYSERTARSVSYVLLRRHDVQVRLGDLKAETKERFDADADDVIKMWWDTATADPNELIQHRVGACRYCHGAYFQFQWKTDRELVEAQFYFDRKWENAKGKAKTETAKLRPSDSGGFGYRSNRPPSPACPECEGEGEGRVVILDTNKLSPQARLLYNGVKETRVGREVLMADRQAALGFVARRLGLLKEQVEVEASSSFAALLEFINTQGSAAPIATARLKLDPVDD